MGHRNTIPKMKARMQAAYRAGTLLAQSARETEGFYWYHPKKDERQKYGFSACAVGCLWDEGKLPELFRDYPTRVLECKRIVETVPYNTVYAHSFFPNPTAYVFARKAQELHDVWSGQVRRYGKYSMRAKTVKKKFCEHIGIATD